MSTAVDTAFEELMSADADAPLHYVCGWCWPDSVPAGIPIALCGHQTTGAAETGFNGRHACARCLALYERPALPCGHRPWR